jgi:hypothetical protein
MQTPRISGSLLDAIQQKMDATNLHVAALGVTALMTVISFLMFVHYALRRNLLWAIICLSCFFILIQPRILIGKTTVFPLFS